MKSIKEMEELLEVEEKDRTDYYELEEDAKLLLAWAKKAREYIKQVAPECECAGEPELFACEFCAAVDTLLAELPEEP